MKTKIYKITAIVGILLGSTITLIGCDSSTPEPDGSSETEASTTDTGVGSLYTEYVKLPDGRTVLCVANWQRTHGGISCDWENAK